MPSTWTHSEVIWATSWREVKPELRKLSLYWLILMAASQSSTELKVLKSGIDLSNSGWEGLAEGAKEKVKTNHIATIWWTIEREEFEQEEKNIVFLCLFGCGCVSKKLQNGDEKSMPACLCWVSIGFQRYSGLTYMFYKLTYLITKRVLFENRLNLPVGVITWSILSLMK